MQITVILDGIVFWGVLPGRVMFAIRHPSVGQNENRPSKPITWVVGI